MDIPVQVTIRYNTGLLWSNNNLDIQIDAALDMWKHDQLADVETLLSAVISLSQNPSHHVLPIRALVGTRLRQLDGAVADAKEVLICRSVPIYTDADSNPHPVHRDSAIRHGLYRK